MLSLYPIKERNLIKKIAIPVVMALSLFATNIADASAQCTVSASTTCGAGGCTTTVTVTCTIGNKL